MISPGVVASSRCGLFDSFDRASLGSIYTSVSTYLTPTISSNVVRGSAGGNDYGVNHNVQSFPANGYVQGTVTFTSSGFQAMSFNMYCGSPSSINNRYRVLWLNSLGGGTLSINKTVSGTDTTVGSTTTLANGTHTFRLRRIGNTLDLFVDGSGTATLSTTDSSLTGGGYCGFEFYQDNANQVGIDNLHYVEL